MAIGELKLGGRVFAIRPLTIGQLREIGIATAGPLPADPVEAEQRTFDRIVKTLAAAMRRDHPDMTEDAIASIETNLPELLGAQRQVLILAGFIASGEAEAAA